MQQLMPTQCQPSLLKRRTILSSNFSRGRDVQVLPLGTLHILPALHNWLIEVEPALHFQIGEIEARILLQLVIGGFFVLIAGLGVAFDF